MQASNSLDAIRAIGGSPTRSRRWLFQPRDDGETESGLKRAHFRDRRTAYLLLAPQMFILLLFFFIPSVRALIQAFQLTDPFGATTQWVGFQNFRDFSRAASIGPRSG